jgi:hypothetical protein
VWGREKSGEERSVGSLKSRTEACGGEAAAPGRVEWRREGSAHRTLTPASVVQSKVETATAISYKLA